MRVQGSMRGQGCIIRERLGSLLLLGVAVFVSRIADQCQVDVVADWIHGIHVGLQSLLKRVLLELIEQSEVLRGLKMFIVVFSMAATLLRLVC